MIRVSAGLYKIVFTVPFQSIPVLQAGIDGLPGLNYTVEVAGDPSVPQVQILNSAGSAADVSFQFIAMEQER